MVVVQHNDCIHLEQHWVGVARGVGQLHNYLSQNRDVTLKWENLAIWIRSTNYCSIIWPAYSVSRFSHMENTVRKTDNTLAASTFNIDVFKDCPLQHKLMKIETSHLHFLNQVKRKRQTFIASQAQRTACTVPLPTPPLHTYVLLWSAPHPCATQHTRFCTGSWAFNCSRENRVSGQPYRCFCPDPCLQWTQPHMTEVIYKITSLSSPSVLRNSVTPLTSFEFINNASPYLQGKKRRCTESYYKSQINWKLESNLL